MSARAAPQRGRQQPGYTVDRRKQLEVFIAKKTTAQKPSVPSTRPDIRSPLMERSNRVFPKKLEQIKPLKKKMAEPVNKENIRPAVTKDGKSLTLTQSFLKTKTLKEKQLKDEKLKLESTKEEPKPAAKHVLGTYRGKIVQSRINSFWNNDENKNLPGQHKAKDISQVKRPLSSDVKPKRPIIPAGLSQIRPSTALPKSKAESTMLRKTTIIVAQQQRPIQPKTQSAKPPLKNVVVKNNQVMPSTKKSSGPVKSQPEPQITKPGPMVPPASKFPKAKESAEERRARLAQWRQCKGKLAKRLPMAAVQPSQHKEHAVKIEQEEPKEEIRQLYWATMAEEDERELFTIKLHQIFGDCQKLIDEGCPREEVVSLLEKQIQTVPEAKKLSGYWECLARLEKRDGQLYKVIAVCEEAVSAGAQPLEELRAILADALEQLKPEPEECVKKGEDQKSEELKTEIKDEPIEKNEKVKRKRGGSRPVKNENTIPSTPDNLPKPEYTPDNGNVMSSVIKFNISTTPHLEKMKQLHMQEGESSIKSYKFLTPVRRSSRLERKSQKLPKMLKDHDPCVSCLDQLGELEDSETCGNAYIFRKNSALNEVTAKSATKKAAPSAD